MQIDLNDEHLKTLFYLNIIGHGNETHKEHHVSFVKSETNNKVIFDCIDCEKTFYSYIVVNQH